MIPAARRRGERGVSLLFAMALVLALAVIAAAVLQYAGRDRIAAARMAVSERGLACAEAGIQYGRRYFGCNYKKTNNWNNILGGTAPGRYDPHFLNDAYPSSVSAIPAQLKGDSTSSGTLDKGTDLDGDGKPDFWVSIRDDDDERPLGAEGGDNRQQDNNLAVYLRSECINPVWATTVGNERRTAVVEVLLVYVPDTGMISRYGTGGAAANPEDVKYGPRIVTTVTTTCD